MRVAALVGVVVALGALAFDRRGGPGGNFSLDEARAFEEFPLYFAGDEIDGLPLTAVLRRSDTADYVSFVYGDCAPSSDGGCAPPGEVQVWPVSARSLDSYDHSVPGTPVPERTRIRGRPAAIVGDGTQLEIYANGATIVIFSDTREHALEIAKGLRCVKGGGAGEAGRLSC